MKQGFVIGHDVGTGGCKGVLATLDGELAAASFEPYPISYPHSGWAEQDPEDWWRAVKRGTARLLSQSGVDPALVVGLGFAGQMLGVVPVNAAGEPLRPAIIWMDSRAGEQARRFVRRLGGKRMVARLAGAVPSGKDVVCKLAWLEENEPDVYGRTRCFLDATGYLVLRATGEMSMDHTAAGGTGILDGRSREWSRLFARILGISLEKMPPLRSSVDVAGPLAAEAASEMGLEPGTPVIAGMADIPGAATGSGALEDGDAHINIGTSSWLCISVASPRRLGKYGIAPVVSADPGMLLMIGESETAGACLEWFAGRFARPEERERREEEGGVFRALDEVAAAVEPGARRLLFAPWLFGERAPVTDAALRGAFVNLGLEHGREHMLRAIYEGVAFNLRWLLDAAATAGLRCDPLRAIGGGARSDLWMQIVSDVTGRTVEAVEHPREAGAMGCALAAALAAGAFREYKEIKRVVRVRRSFEPGMDSRHEYDRLYGAFRCLHSRLTGVCSRLNA